MGVSRSCTASQPDSFSESVGHSTLVGSSGDRSPDGLSDPRIEQAGNDVVWGELIF